MLSSHTSPLAQYSDPKPHLNSTVDRWSNQVDSPLFKLPPEIRQMIYDLFLTGHVLHIRSGPLSGDKLACYMYSKNNDKDSSVLHKYSTQSDTFFMPFGIVRACRKAYSETLNHVYEEKVFTFKEWNQFCEFETLYCGRKALTGCTETHIRHIMIKYMIFTDVYSCSTASLAQHLKILEVMSYQCFIWGDKALRDRALRAFVQMRGLEIRLKPLEFVRDKDVVDNLCDWSLFAALKEVVEQPKVEQPHVELTEDQLNDALAKLFRRANDIATKWNRSRPDPAYAQIVIKFW